MKTILSLLAFAFVVISACMIWILKSGVSLRTAPIIKPSIISPDSQNIGQGIFLRLFPDIQQSHYFVWKVNQNSNEVQTTLAAVKERTEKDLHQKVNIIYDGTNASAEEIHSCSKPCWILLPEDSTTDLTLNTDSYFTLSWNNFDRDLEVSQECIEEKRLELACIKPVSINEVRRKLKDPQARYFFMRKYLDHDYFLFVEATKE